MTIFKATDSKKKPVGNKDNAKKENFTTFTSNASEAINDKYKATSRCLGKGSFGKVYQFKSKDPKSTQNYAVKLILKELLPERELDTLREEINLLSSMDHENIANYIESFEDDKYLFIVMEDIEGAVELRHYINKN